MGVKFDGHPDLRRILLPNNWPNHPLRKDVPRGGEPVPFSMTWEDEEFASFGKQIIEAKAVPQVPPKQADANKHMILNMGPQHPATHGVLRVIVELDGETVVAAYPDIGYLHSGFEKQGETIRYKDFTPYTDRTDYVSSMSNNLGYALAVEKLMGVEIPPRAQVIRVIMAELQRLASHLLWLATHVMDAAGLNHALLMYCFREREQILDILELVSGARLTTSYIRPGGVWKDVPPSFADRVQDVLRNFPKRIRRIRAHGHRPPGVEGAHHRHRQADRGAGARPGRHRPDAARFGRGVRLSQGAAVQRLRKLRLQGPDLQRRRHLRALPGAPGRDAPEPAHHRAGLKNLPDGPVWTADRKMALPPRQELDTSMEALIHHFKLNTEGFIPPKGEVYECVEGPRGETGFYLVSDGTAIPYRLRYRTPSFVNLQATNTMAARRPHRRSGGDHRDDGYCVGGCGSVALVRLVHR